MKVQKYKTTGNRGFFDEQENYEKLSAIGNPLELISNVVDFEIFRNTLEESLLNKEKKSNAGAKPYDKGQDLHADSAYTGEDQEKVISKYEMNNKVHEKGYRNKSLTPWDNSINQSGEVKIKTISHGVNR